MKCVAFPHFPGLQNILRRLEMYKVHNSVKTERVALKRRALRFASNRESQLISYVTLLFSNKYFENMDINSRRNMK